MSPDRGVLTPTTKRCRRCARDLPITEFFRRRDTSDGRASYCKSCTAVAAAVSRGRRKDSLKIAAEERARELASSGVRINYAAESIEVRVALLKLLDVPGRTPHDTARRAGCSPSTVYRHRRLALNKVN